MAVLKLVSVLLLLANANGDITTLITKYNSTITGKCTLDQTTTTVVTTAAAATTATTATTASTATTDTTATPTTTTTDTTATPTTTTTDTTPTTTTATTLTTDTTDTTDTTATTGTTHMTEEIVRRKKRAADQLLCVTEETKVIASSNVTEFHTNLQAFSVCQKMNCTSLTSAVDELLNESGATEVKICGILLCLMFVISYFG